MIRNAILAAILALLSACSVASVDPIIDCPREGGIGGTGNCEKTTSV